MRLKRHTVSRYQTIWPGGRYRYLAPGAIWAGDGGMPRPSPPQRARREASEIGLSTSAQQQQQPPPPQAWTAPGCRLKSGPPPAEATRQQRAESSSASGGPRWPRSPSPRATQAVGPAVHPNRLGKEASDPVSDEAQQARDRVSRSR